MNKLPFKPQKWTSQEWAQLKGISKTSSLGFFAEIQIGKRCIRPGEVELSSAIGICRWNTSTSPSTAMLEDFEIRACSKHY